MKAINYVLIITAAVVLLANALGVGAGEDELASFSRITFYVG
jgi:hypothetical protein